MRLDHIIALTLAVGIPAGACAQAHPVQPFGTAAHQTPAMEFSIGYMYLHANAPPSQCGCFALNGGFGALVVNAPHGLSLVADLSSAHGSTASGNPQSITLFNYVFGPRYSWRSRSREFTIYGQVLAGRSLENSRYAAIQTKDAFALSSGGGFSLRVTPRLGWNVAEASWLHSDLPNAQTNRQNDIRLSSGLIFRFGPR